MEIINDYKRIDYSNMDNVYLNIPLNGIVYSVVTKYKNTHVKLSPIVNLILNLLNAEFGKNYPFSNKYMIPNFQKKFNSDLLWTNSGILDIKQFLSQGIMGKVYSGVLYFNHVNNVQSNVVNNQLSRNSLKNISVVLKMQNQSSMHEVYSVLETFEDFLYYINNNVVAISNFFYENDVNQSLLDINLVYNTCIELIKNINNEMVKISKQFFVKDFVSQLSTIKMYQFINDFESIVYDELKSIKIPYLINRMTTTYTQMVYNDQNQNINDYQTNLGSLNTIFEIFTQNQTNNFIINTLVFQLWVMYLKLWSFVSTFYLFYKKFLNSKEYSLYYNNGWADVIVGWNCGQLSQLKMSHIFPKLYDVKYDSNTKKIILLMENFHVTFLDFKNNDFNFFHKNNLNINNNDTYDASILGSILCQLIVGLSIAQTYIGFVHNDFHESNIMFKKTDKKNIYYTINLLRDNVIIDIVYLKIPLYKGMILKIIDFGRSSTVIRDLTNRYKNLIFPIEYRNPESSLVFATRTSNKGELNNLIDVNPDGSIYNKLLNTYSPDYQTTDLTNFFTELFLNTKTMNGGTIKQPIYTQNMPESKIYNVKFSKIIKLNDETDTKINEIKKMLESIQKNVFLCNSGTPNFFKERDLYLNLLIYSTYSDATIDKDCPNLNPINLFLYFQPYRITKKQYEHDYADLHNVFYEADINLNANYRNNAHDGNIYKNSGGAI